MKDQILIEFADQENDRVAAMIEIEAMKAENDRCKYDGVLPRYGEKDFRNILELYKLKYGDIIQKNANFYKRLRVE